MFQKNLVFKSLFAGMILSLGSMGLAATKTFEVKLDQIRTFANGKVVIDVNKNVCDTGTGAAGPNEDFAVVPANAVGRDLILATSMGALLADKTVNIWVTDPATAGGSCTLDSINIKK